MKERPILFSGPMMRAILDGRKTQTRRVITPQPVVYPNAVQFRTLIIGGTERSALAALASHCPYGKPGDRLWVRETFWCKNENCDHDYCSGCDMGSLLSVGEGYAPIDYVATPKCLSHPETEHQQTVEPWTGEPVPGYWWLAPPDDWDGEDEQAHRERGVWTFLPWGYHTKHPSIHMPRWASRLLLEVTEVRVERLNEISEEDARAEGAEPKRPAGAMEISAMPVRLSHIVGFRELWCSINSNEAWDANPWVWVVSFRVLGG